MGGHSLETSNDVREWQMTKHSKLDVDPDKLKEQAADLGATLTGAAVHAKEWTTPRVEAFIDWLLPRLENAYNESVKAAAPRVEKAAEKAGPAIDTAHDKLVDELIPRLVTALNEAAEKAGAAAVKAADTAAEVAKANAAELKKQVHVAPPKKSHKGLSTFMVVGLLVGAGAAGAAWFRSRSTVDPWAEPWEPTDPTGGTGADALHTHTHDVRASVTDAVGDAADAVGEVAGSAVAKSREATRKAAEKLDEARASAEEAAKKVTRRTANKAEDVADATEDAVEKDNPSGDI
ncbi:hypothetical protein CELD12_33580 [Cellulomonas sp. NTE-D12]|nr:hypothetical protein CELD12_33580 [Cellulomonas sp. NTE-D12]